MHARSRQSDNPIGIIIHLIFNLQPCGPGMANVASTSN